MVMYKPMSLMTIILASASPRRAELLQQLGLDFQTDSADIDERPLIEESVLDYVTRMAQTKNRLIREQYQPDSLVIGADTSVSIDEVIMGKPQDQSDFESMMTRLSGRTHCVHTAVSVSYLGKCLDAVSISEVSFRALVMDEIRDYWHTGEPLDKAGGYAIQGLAAKFIQHLSGSYSGVMGLPLFELSELIQCLSSGDKNE